MNNAPSTEEVTQQQAETLASGGSLFAYGTGGFNVGLSPEDLLGETEELTEFEKLQQRIQNATGGSQ